MARKKLIPTPVEQAGLLIEFGKMALLVAEQLQAEEKSIKDFPLDEADRATVYNLVGILPTLQKKLAKKDATFTVADTIGIVMALAESLLEAEPVLRVKLLILAQRLRDCLESNLEPTEPVRIPVKKSKATDTVYQFKITLFGGKLGAISIYGQESNATTRRLAVMNLALRGIEADFGPEQADTFRRDLSTAFQSPTLFLNAG